MNRVPAISLRCVQEGPRRDLRVPKLPRKITKKKNPHQQPLFLQRFLVLFILAFSDFLQVFPPDLPTC